jgi:hypothetical protein
MISMAADDRGCRQPASLSRISKRNRLAAAPEAARPRRRHRDFEFTGNVNRHGILGTVTQVDVEVIRRACEAQAIGGSEAVMSLDAGAELDHSSVGIAS